MSLLLLNFFRYALLKMIHIIYEWIQTRLGKTIVMEPEAFANYVRDGCLLADILRNYEIITEGQRNMIETTKNTTKCFDHFKNHLRHWLKTIKIDLDDIRICAIVNGDVNETINLCYQMYLELFNKSSLNFVTSQRQTEKLRPTTEKFTVKTVSESKLGCIENCTPLESSPMVDDHDVIHWHKDRFRVLLKQCQVYKEEYIDYLTTKRNSTFPSGSTITWNKNETYYDLNDFSDEPKDLSYSELKAEAKATKEMPVFQANPRESKRIVNSLKVKKRQETERVILKEQLHKDVMCELWQTLKKNEDEAFDKYISDKLLRQSMYEKQMVNMLAEVRLQKEVIVNNRRLLDEVVFKEKEKEFVQKLLAKDEKIDEQKMLYYLEHERLLELHRRIYHEKRRLERQKNYDMCKSSVEDIVNVALRESEYQKQYGEKPSRRMHENLKTLFVANQPIFDVVVPVENIVKPDVAITDSEEAASVEQEIDRQDVQNGQDFDNYIQYQWPWELTNVQLANGDLNTINRGLNVLGGIVHKLLLIKYPPPPLPPVPDFPDVKTAVCINGLPDDTILPLLQKLLNEKGIHCVQMQNVTNFCIEVYNAETKNEDDNVVLAEETGQGLVEKKHRVRVKKADAKRSKKPKHDFKSRVKHESANIEEEVVAVDDLLGKFDDKLCQTPKFFPGEEIELSSAAELGKIAWEELSLGLPLTDYLLINMFVEYLKSLSDLKGWVLVNYPTSFEQATLLETALTGQTMLLPGMTDKQMLTKSLSSFVEAQHRYEEKPLDNRADDRQSKILPNPFQASPEDAIYNTYLTAYIQIKHKKIDDNVNESLPPTLIEPGSSDNSLEKFYSDMGCNYCMYYETFDMNTIKYLAKLIIGDYTIPLKSSIELFGDTVEYMEVGTKLAQKDRPGSVQMGTKKEKPIKRFKIEKRVEEAPKSKKSSKGKKSGKHKGSNKSDHAPIVQADKWLQVPEIEDEVDEDIPEESAAPLVLKVGEPGWEYLDIAFPEPLQLSLTNFWEVAENVYEEDFKQLFFIKRCTLDAVMPYVNYIKEHMQGFIARPNNKQSFLKKFQKAYNAIDQDFRGDDELKAELHYQVRELSDKLQEACDKSMLDSMEQHKVLINENWLTKQLCQITNYCIGIFQVELNRFVDSLQIINDYYTAIVTKMPVTDRLDKINLPIVDTCKILADPAVLKSINDLLENTEVLEQQTVFHKEVGEKLNKTLSFVKDCEQFSLGCCDKVKAVFRPKTTKSRGTGYLKFFEPDDVVKDNHDKLFDEWSCALTGELARVKLQLQLIQFEGFCCLDEVLKCCQNGFRGVFEAIRTRYQNEMASIETACKVLCRAIEEELPIQEELYFIDDKFGVVPENLLFDDPLPVVEPLKEFEADDVFTIEQLDVFTEILLDLAPSGYIPERTFAYLLQDMIQNDAEDGRAKMVPKLWQKLEPDDVDKLMIEIFDHLEYVQWKDFILTNLQVDFPNELELLTLRNAFRACDPDKTEVIADYQFEQIRFWFETNELDALRLKLLKKLIFKLYRMKNGSINYTALLLDFSKDRNPLVGFAKALEVSLGKLICWNEDVGMQYVAKVLNQRRIDDKKEEQHRLHHEACLVDVDEILMDVIDQTVHQVDSVFIEDVETTVTKSISRSESTNEIMEYLKNTHMENEWTENADEQHDQLINLILENVFTNAAIGFEPDADAPLVHFLPLEVVLVVVMTALPWHAIIRNIDDKSLREHIEEIYEECRNASFNNSVLAHEFLNHPRLRALMEGIKRFSAKNPVITVKDLLVANTDASE